MTREEAKEKIIYLKRSMRNSGIFSSDIFEALDMAIEALSVEPQEWISVKKHGNPKLKDGKNYDTFLTTSKWVGESGDEIVRVDINVWNRGGTWSYHSWGGDEVIAWMPLPSPYKGEEDDNDYKE